MKQISFLIWGSILLMIMASCGKDVNEPLAPDLARGVYFIHSQALFDVPSAECGSRDGTLSVRAIEPVSGAHWEMLIRDKIPPGHYNFANIFNVSMIFRAYDGEEYYPVAGNFDLYELSVPDGRLKATFDCVLKSKRDGHILQLRDGRVHVYFK